jgi:hypothetical protein
MVRSRNLWAVPAAALLLWTAGCGGGSNPAPAADQRARGLAIVNAAGKHVADAQSFTFHAHWEGDRVKRSGEKVPMRVDQAVSVRRPDRMFMKSTGDLDLELYYDGTEVTLVTPSAKVYGVVPAGTNLSDTIGDTIDRYDIPFPLADLINFTSAEQLVTDATTGGYVGDEVVDGKETSKVSWQHPNLDWTLWVSKDAEPVPVRLHLLYKGRTGQPERTYDFSAWQFGADLPDTTFTANVPADYEGIAVLQRASAVLPPDDASTAAEGGSDKEK